MGQSQWCAIQISSSIAHATTIVSTAVIVGLASICTRVGDGVVDGLAVVDVLRPDVGDCASIHLCSSELTMIASCNVDVCVELGHNWIG